MFDSENKHLKFYTEHKIAPVKQVAALERILNYRRSLYEPLGLHGLAIRGSDVLEVACGTGENSLFVACQDPTSLTLLEPNPAAYERVKSLYAHFHGPHTPPEILQCRLEDFFPERRYDIVICENWLGSSSYDRELRRRLMALGNQYSMLVVTAISPTGMLPNLLRRIISHRVTQGLLNREETQRLTDLWAPHLNSMTAMTRSHEDWVVDNMVNPAYLSICVSPINILEQAVARYRLNATYPKFMTDLRWFKALPDYQPQTDLRIFSDQYLNTAHNFISVNLTASQSDKVLNERLESDCASLFSSLALWENSTGDQKDLEWSGIVERLRRITGLLSQIFPSGDSDAMGDCISQAIAPAVDLDAIKSCRYFSQWFGRETIYMSLTRR